MHVLGLMCIYAQNEIFPCTAKRFSTWFAWRALGPFFPFFAPFPARARGRRRDDDGDGKASSSRQQQAASIKQRYVSTVE